MDIPLTPTEARVLGSMVEKERTTPDNYPLSLHAITAACNQKSNRNPVMSLSEGETQDALDTLMTKSLIREKNPAGSRVTKYAHRLTGGLGFSLSFSDNESAILCTLMLRGPQTLAEIRTNTSRLCRFESREDVERTLGNLEGREDGPFVVKLARAPGRKEARYAHLLCGEVEHDVALEPAPSRAATVDNERIDTLERVIEELRADLDDLRRRLDLRDATDD